jgi:TonB family protein
MRRKATNGSELRRQPFSYHDWGRIDRRQLAISSALHVASLVALGWISALVVPEIVEPDHSIQVRFLVKPEPAIEEEIPPVEPRLLSKPLPQLEPAPAPTPPSPPPTIPPVEIVEVQEAMSPAPTVPPPEPPPTPPRPEIRIDSFARASAAAAPGLDAPAHNVQTGGFGDHNGLPMDPTTPRQAVRAQLGAFDLPAGPGQGDGAAGANGRRGTVAGAGFGNKATIPEAGAAPVARDGARAAGFAQAIAPAEPSRPKARVLESTTFPVEIVFKPEPAYTEEARQKRLEGEVVLEVLFSASGRTQVLRVVSGLGSGLDESAVRAAEQIRFKPARRDGQSVDHTAVVRIIFQLA